MDDTAKYFLSSDKDAKQIKPEIGMRVEFDGGSNFFVPLLKV